MAYIHHTMQGNGMVQNIRQPRQAIVAGIETIAPFALDRGQYSRFWRALGYTTAFLPILFLAFFAWNDPDFNRSRISDWKSVLTLAQTSRDSGDLIEARSLYSRAGRMAVWQDDWTGMLAAACGIHRLNRETGTYSTIRMLLLRAMITAEKKQSRAGIAAVANAFEQIGQNDATRMVLARERPEWPDETPDSADTYKNDCW